jgi:hypothetical protein
MKVNPELHSLIPPLSADEYALLEANILQDGCRDPLIIWEEEETLLDGHNRRTICEQHGLPYTCHAISLPDLDAAKAWMIANQLGRRNLTPEQISYYRGGQYNLYKRQGKRTDVTSPQSEGKLPSTAERFATGHHVSVATIERDGSYARDVDLIAEAVGPEARQSLLARETKVTKRDVRKLAQIAKDGSPQTAKHVLEAVAEAKTPSLASHVVQEAHRHLTRVAASGSGAGLAVEPEIPKAKPSTTAVVDPAPTAAAVPAVTLDFVALVDRAYDALNACLAAMYAAPLTVQADLDAAAALEEVCEQMIEALEYTSIAREAREPEPAPAPVPPPAPPVATKPARKDPVIRRVWRFVQQEQQPRTAAQVAQALKIRRDQALEALKTLVKQGKVRKDGQQYVDKSIEERSPVHDPNS